MSILAALILSLIATAQDAAPPVTPPAVQDATGQTPPVPDAAALGFDTRQDRMTLPVTIAGAGPFAFIVDTGAQRTVISRELAATLGLAAGPGVRMTAMTGASQVATVVIPKITVGVLGGSDIQAPVLQERFLGAAGLLGLDTLQDRTLSIDFDANTMTVTPASRRRYKLPAATNEVVIYAKSVLGQLVVTEASYQGTRVRVVLDTGSAVTIGNLALRRRVGRRTGIPITLMSVTGEMLSADYMQLREVKVGRVAFADLPVAFADAAPFERFGLRKRPAMLLGMDALRMFRRVDIDFANREVRLALPRGTRR